MQEEEKKQKQDEAMQALRDHEAHCEKRHTAINKRFDRLEDKADRHTWGFVGIAGLIIAASFGIVTVILSTSNNSSPTHATQPQIILLDKNAIIGTPSTSTTTGSNQ